MRTSRPFLVFFALLIFVGFGASDAVPGGTARQIEFVDSWIIVKLREPLRAKTTSGALSTHSGFAALDQRISEAGVWKIEKEFSVSRRTARDPTALERWGLERIYKFYVPEGSDVLALVETFSRLDEVEYAEPDYLGRGCTVPDDPLFGNQWNLINTGQYEGIPGSDIDATLAWDIAVGGKVVIAVTDSGVDPTHPEFTTPVNKLLPGWDFINNDDEPWDDTTVSHGTRVASTAAANTGNAQGVAGVCWDCPIMPVKVLNEENVGLNSSIRDGWVWAADRGADIVNNSIVTGSSAQANHDALRYVTDAGAFFVSAAGNEGVDSIRFAARYPETIAVATSKPDDSPGNASNWGRELDMLAPGNKIWAAEIGGLYGYGGGTSYATPHVSGALGVMLTVNPSLGREEARRLLHAGAEDLVGEDTTPGHDIYYGFGRLNLHRTLLGTISSSSLRVEGKAATRLLLDTPFSLAGSYDFIRGDLHALSESPAGVDMGSVLCLENDSADADTAGGNEDLATPAPGDAFFYLARFNVVDAQGTWPGSYGGSSRHRDRVRSEPLLADATCEIDMPVAWLGAVAPAGDVDNDGYDDIVVGAEGYHAPVEKEGAAFVFRGSASGVVSTPAWETEGVYLESRFGYSVASAGDVNNDGYDDVIVGAPFLNNGHGGAYVYHGSDSGTSLVADWSMEGNQAFALFGYRVASAGDVNDDGHDDVIVTAPLYDNPEVDEGRAYLYLGTASGLLSTATFIVESNQAGAQFGRDAGAAGKQNDDSFDDFVIGAPFYDNGETDEGRIYVYRGRSLGTPVLLTTLELDVAHARLGHVAARAGDVNDDLHDDIVAGAWTDRTGPLGRAAAFVFHGSATGPDSTPDWSFEVDLPTHPGVDPDSDLAPWGVSAASAGDVNGDGVDDVIVGADYYHLTEKAEGRAWLFRGSATGLSTTSSWTDVGGQRDAAFGWRVASAGDVDNDGDDEILVGSRWYDAGEFNEGRVFIYHGSGSGPSSRSIFACDGP